MKAAVFIMSHSGATKYTARNWPFFKRCGADLFGVTREDTVCVWPEPIPCKAIGKEGYLIGDDQCRRMIETLAWFRDDPRFENYTHAWLMQGDALLLGPLPQLEYDLAAHLAGGIKNHEVNRFRSSCFYHPPWVVSRKIVDRFVSTGRTLLDSGASEDGIPDYFFTLVCETLKCPVFNIPGIVSSNGGDLLTRKSEWEPRIRNPNCWYVHAVQTRSELEWVLQQHKP